ncbi:polysaccharide biosynthesis tyrosine autokinase [Caballeronia sp. HLA56]
MKQENLPVMSHGESSDQLSIVELLDALLDHRKLIAIVAALFVIVGAMYAFLATPVYSSRILVAVEDSSDAASAKNLLSDVSAMFDVKSSADGEIQILGSRLVASGTVDALKLNVEAKPRYFPVFGKWMASHNDGLSNPGVFGWGGFDWGSESIELAAFEVPRKLQGRSYDLTVLKDSRYSLSGYGLESPVTGSIGTEEKFNSSFGALTLKVTKLSGRPGASFVLKSRSSQLTTDDLIKSLQIIEQGKHSGVISATLESTDPVLLSDTLNELGRQYVKQNADRKAAQAEHSISFLDAQLPVMKQQLEDAEAKLSEYQNSHTIVDLSEAGKVSLQQSADAETRLIAMKQKRQDLATRFGPMHPSLLAIDEQIATNQKQIDSIAAQIRQMPLTEQDMLKLQRDVRVSTDLYVAMRSNVEQLRLVKAGKIGNVRIVDTADIPERPVKPRKLIVMAAAAIVGLFLGTLLALVKDRLFTGVTDPISLEEHTGLSVYATIPVSDKQAELIRNLRSDGSRPLVLANLYPNDPAVESLRSLRTAFKFVASGGKNNVVLIAGPTPGIGKSFVSVNFATVLASSGARVLLIDADMRKGYLNRYFGLGRDAGLSDAISEARSVDSVVHRDVLPNLDFVSSGNYPQNPAEVLSHKNWGDFISAASRAYDVVIVDAPPVLVVSDAETIVGSAGSVFLVTRSGVTRGGEVSESIKRLTQTGTQVTGLLFNAIKPRGRIYGYGGRYQSYRYTGDGYYQDRS